MLFAWYRWILLALKKQRYMPDSGILLVFHGASWAVSQLCLQGLQSFFTVCLLVCPVSLSRHSGPGPAGFILRVVCHFSHLLLPNGRSSHVKCQQQLMVALFLCYLNCVLFSPPSLCSDAGFEIPNLFVVGYALDYNEYFRDLNVSLACKSLTPFSQEHCNDTNLTDFKNSHNDDCHLLSVFCVRNVPGTWHS